MNHSLPIGKLGHLGNFGKFDKPGHFAATCRHLGVHLLTVIALWLPCLSLFLFLPCSAQAGVRQFPPTAKRGVLRVTQPPDVQLNDQPARLSPGVRIKSTANLIVMSASLVGLSLTVNYVTDGQGLLHEVWLLSEQEAQMDMSEPGSSAAR